MSLSQMLSRTVEESSTVEEACERFFHDVADWANACRIQMADLPATDGHDQGTFTTSWSSHIVSSGDDALLEFLKQTRDRICDHMIVRGLWHHGYWRTQEAHHGTEHFEIFLGNLWELDPDDEKTIEQMVDAAEHLGNWEPSVPAWFDWSTGLFLSTHFGTDGVIPKMRGVNIADHFRCANIALRTFEMTDDSRYLDLVTAYVSRWVDAILADDDIPVGVGPRGPAYDLEKLGEEGDRWFAGQANWRNSVDRAENLVASGAVDTLLDLFERLNDRRCVDAALRLLDVAARELTDSDAGCAADAIATYRRRTGDTRYDERLRTVADLLDPEEFTELSLSPEPPAHEARPTGFGKRADVPDWFEDGQPRRHHPVTLACLAEATDDEALAIRAVDVGRAAFALAREAYRSGRHHGCSARTVNAVARGHGRENGAGVVTACLDRVYAHFVA